jgi:hypothetical protein
MLSIVTYSISILLNVDGISKFVNNVNTVYIVLSVGLNRFLIVGNL